MNRSDRIRDLRDRIGAVQSRAWGDEVLPTATGVGLRLRAVHEWLSGGVAEEWSPPLLPLVDACRRGLESGVVSGFVWVGRGVFVYPPVLARAPGVLAGCVFVDASGVDERVWAMDVALRSGAGVLVVGDGRGLSLAHTRRLQLAAGSGRGVALLARESREEGSLSAALTRWRVTPRVGACVGWTLTLLRNKDHRTPAEEAGRYDVEWSDAGLVPAPGVVECRSGASA